MRQEFSRTSMARAQSLRGCRAGVGGTRADLAPDVDECENGERSTNPYVESPMIASTLTLFELEGKVARYVAYPALADVVHDRFTAPKKTLRGRFACFVFNNPYRQHRRPRR